VETSNDAELDSYLENRHLNLIGNDRALRTMTNNIFSVILNIEQAAHLSTIYSKQQSVSFCSQRISLVHSKAA
jgi:hypothetical protein